VTESFSSPAAQRKTEQEIAAFRDYQQLSRKCVAVNEKICRVRQVEISRMLGVVFGAWRKTGRVDLEAVEMRSRGGPALRERLTTDNRLKIEFCPKLNDAHRDP
jgi:hypothetical protein